MEPDHGTRVESSTPRAPGIKNESREKTPRNTTLGSTETRVLVNMEKDCQVAHQAVSREPLQERGCEEQRGPPPRLICHKVVMHTRSRVTSRISLYHLRKALQTIRHIVGIQEVVASFPSKPAPRQDPYSELPS